MAIDQTQVLFTEIFPVKRENLPILYAYRLDARGDDFSTIGGKLAYRLKRLFPGHWAWAGSLVVTDSYRPDQDVKGVVKDLWSEQPTIFKNLRDVNSVKDWHPDARTYSEFVARGLLSDAEKKVQQVLSKNKQDLGNAVVERIHELRGWVVEGLPAVSVAITSRAVLKEDLKSYALRAGQGQIIGLQVADKTGTFKGEIVEVVGTLATERQRLVSITQREEMQQIIANSPDSDLVVTVSNGRNDYDYVIGALRIILYTEYMHKFGINTRKALGAFRLQPDLRADIVKGVSAVLTETQYLDRAYSTRANPNLFRTIPYTADIKFGNGTTAPYNEQTIINDLRNRKLFRIADPFKNGSPIKVGILTALDNPESHKDFWTRLESGLRSLSVNVRKLGEVVIKEASRAELDKAISQLENQGSDILIAFFPEDFADEDDDETAYHHFKSLTVGRGIPSQVVEDSTIENDKSITSSVNNIILGILGKTGNIPYVLAKPLDFADVIVGIDIARDKKKRLSGSINATAFARVYMSDGEFLEYAIHDAPLEGETVPAIVLQSLFPQNEFAGKRVIVHRDGYFRGDEKKALLDWGKKINADFLLVEVIKSGSPRMYALVNNQTVQPKKGSAFVISDTEAILVSSLPPFKNATPQPLRIRTQSPLNIEQAIESVLALTNLHYGSVRSPRLPVTIHYSDKIGYMALRGIKPKNLRGKIPYWL